MSLAIGRDVTILVSIDGGASYDELKGVPADDEFVEIPQPEIDSMNGWFELDVVYNYPRQLKHPRKTKSKQPRVVLVTRYW